MYELVAEEQGVAPAALRGTVQNDVLKEYIARGTYIFPPAPSLRLTAETITYCAEHLPRFNPISISGYHMAEAGATPVQEVAFTLANAIAYVEAALARGLDVDRFAPEGEKGHVRGAYLPFGAGPRVCVGAAFAQTEALLILARLVQRYEIEVLDPERVEPCSRLTTRPLREIMVRVRRR
jgi:hypothetical protein